MKHRIRFTLCQREALANAKHSSDVTCDVFDVLVFVFLCMFNSLHDSGHMWTGLDYS